MRRIRRLRRIYARHFDERLENESCDVAAPRAHQTHTLFALYAISNIKFYPALLDTDVSPMENVVCVPIFYRCSFITVIEKSKNLYFTCLRQLLSAAKCYKSYIGH